MNKNFRLLVAILVLFAMFSIAIPAVQADSCGWTVYNYPVSGGTISGQGCAYWHPYDWFVYGMTWAPYSYVISTWIGGYDTCNGFDWTLNMTTGYHNSWNTTYDQTGVASAAINGCPPGYQHNYAVSGSHYKKTTSSSNWEGSTGTVYH